MADSKKMKKKNLVCPHRNTVRLVSQRRGPTKTHLVFLFLGHQRAISGRKKGCMTMASTTARKIEPRVGSNGGNPIFCHFLLLHRKSMNRGVQTDTLLGLCSCREQVKRHADKINLRIAFVGKLCLFTIRRLSRRHS